MMTSAAQIGIDSCPIEGFNREKLEQVFVDEGVLDRERFGVSCMVVFGYRKNQPRSKNSKSMDEIVEVIK
jgi:Nitroreductase